MNRTEKEQLVSELRDVFNTATTVVVTRQSGMSVVESSELRAKMRESGASYRVAKNRLVKIALQGTKFEGLANNFTGPTAIAYSEDAVAPAKVAVEFAKANDKIQVIGGGMDDKILSEAEIQALATMPTLDELRGKLVGVLQAPATKVAGVVQAPAAQLARLLNAYATK